MIMAVTGPLPDEQLGPTAIHEHVMVDFHDPSEPPRAYDRAEVVGVMEPYLLELKRAGCAVFVDCTPDWLGRDPLVLLELSRRTGLHILTNTGWYNAPMVPPQAYTLSEEEIAAHWVEEARAGIGSTGVRPGFIKIALNGGPGHPAPMQMKILRAAMLASLQTGLAIVSHTIGSAAALDAAQCMEQAGFDLERFIWAHADAFAEEGEQRIQLARRGMRISLDGIGDDYEKQTAMLRQMGEAGVLHRALISKDSGWYNVGEPMGGKVRPFHTLFTEFLPYAEAHGIKRALLDQITIENAVRALRIRPGKGE